MIINHFNTMIQNIKINNKNSIDAKLYSANYYDFMLYKGGIKIQNEFNLNSISLADFSDLNIVNGILYSNTTWSGSTNNGVELNDIGLTGMDNGLIYFRKDRITNEEFLKLLLESKYNISANDNRLFLTPVTGNTQMYEYPLYLIEEENEKYISFKGGFYQGFFKLVGHDYQVLPDKIENEWVFHFNLRPRSDYNVKEELVNYTHKNNEGIFFFMGTRAENKFWPFYKTNENIMSSLKVNDATTDGYFDISTYNIKENNVVFLENDWVADENKKEELIEESYFAIGDGYFTCPSLKDPYNATGQSIITKDYCHCLENDEYFKDGYYDGRCVPDTNKFITSDYIGSGASINVNGYDDSIGHAMSAHGYNDIITDNKFLLFDRTSSGYTVDTWEEGTKALLMGRRDWPNANYFLLMNRTKTGYTIDNISLYNEENKYDYNIHKDIRNNVFALRIKNDGSIGYKYGILNCENDEKYEVIEEYSKPNLVKKDEWNNVNVKISILNPTSNQCKNTNKKMKIYFYVNGFLIFISKELDAFNFKPIDDVAQKQETVPYNISLGGGSLGLMETILPNYYAISDYILPIERDFCGTFMGDIKSFKIFGDTVYYSTIKELL